ncbi:ATP-binding protein [Sphingobacterium sp. KU25419]|nr:ATP-binding protein [Sphingobacterium sp. KU25419]
MKTAEILKNLTDRALYERISNSILRLKFPVLENLIEGGLNEQGETVKSRLDSFCKIDDSHFALIEHTTNDSNLEGKWLYDPTQYKGKKEKADQSEGDLLKAIGDAEAIRRDIPYAKFTVYMTTNQNVTSDLWSKVMATAAGKVSVELIEVKTLANFLDVDPRGQYLRKIYLGIEQELLSVEMLKELQIISQEQYATETFIDTASIVENWNVDALLKVVDNSSNQLTLVLSESGYGKSTLCYNLMNEFTKSNRFCLRINEAIISSSSSLLNAVTQYIQYLKPNVFLNSEVGNLIDHNSVVIIVDDINKAIDPLKTLEKLLAWTVFAKKHGETRLRVVCPVWPKYYGRLTDTAKKEGEYNAFSFEKPNQDFAKRIVKKWLHEKMVSLSEFEINELITGSGRDPLLLNLSMHLISKGKFDVHTAGSQVIKSFAFEKIASTPIGSNLPEIKIKLLLQRLGISILSHKNMNPSYTKLIEWLGKDEELLKFIDEVASNKAIFFFDDNDLLQYRHDRIRDYILTEGLSLALFKMDTYADVMTDPFFSSLLGEVISGAKLSDLELDNLAELCPQAIFSSLRYLQGADHQIKRERVMNSIRKWKSSAHYNSVHPAILGAIVSDMTQSNLTDIVELTENFPTSLSVLAAKFRNGDVTGAIHFFTSHMEFEPFIGNKYRDLIIDHVSIHHKNKLVNQLTSIMVNRQLTEVGLKGALLLAGYLKDPRLVEDITGYWQHSPNETLLNYYLWGVVNCINEGNKDKAFSLLEFFMALPNEGGEENGFPKGIRNRILYNYSKIWWRLNDEQITILAENVNDFKPLITSIFDHIDHPTTLKIMVDSIADNLELAHPQSSYALFHPGDKWDYKKNGYRLKPESLCFLLEYWKDKTNTPKQREVAFRYWTNNEEKSLILNQLSFIDGDDPLNERIVRERILLGDVSIVHEFAKLVQLNPFHIRIAHFAWNNEMKKVYRETFVQERQNFESTEIRHFLVKILVEIPTKDAEALLVEFWKDILDDVFAIQTALYIGTEETIKLAQAHIATNYNPSGLFVFVDQVYKCHNRDAEKRITIEKLEILKPYFKYINQHSLNMFADHCIRSGYNEWYKNNLASSLTRRLEELQIQIPMTWH